MKKTQEIDESKFMEFLTGCQFLFDYNSNCMSSFLDRDQSNGCTILSKWFEDNIILSTGLNHKLVLEINDYLNVYQDFIKLFSDIKIKLDYLSSEFDGLIKEKKEDFNNEKHSRN